MLATLNDKIERKNSNLKKIIDKNTTENIIYVGETRIGKKNGDCCWSIFIMDKTEPNFTYIKYPVLNLEATDSFSFIWDNRENYTYE